MARLLLHIGAYKTATSYIQRRFHLNRELFARHGIIYPDIGPNPAHHILATPWIDIPTIPDRYWGEALSGSGKKCDVFFENFVKEYASREGTVFLSAEVFGRALPQKVDMADLSKRFSAFEDVRIIYVVRHQTDYIQSIWLQIAKVAKAPHFDPFLAKALQNRLASGVWIDHCKVIENVLSGFEPDQLVVMDYEAMRQHPVGVMGPFLDLMKSPLDVRDLAELDSRNANVSPDPLSTWMAHSVFFPNPIKKGLHHNLQSIVEDIKKTHGKKKTSLYTRAQYQRVVQAAEEMNVPLRQWLESGPSGVAVPAVPSTEATMFRDDLTKADWEPHLPEGNKRMREKLESAFG